MPAVRLQTENASLPADCFAGEKALGASVSTGGESSRGQPYIFFIFALCLGAATFNLLGSLLGGLLIFLLLYFGARWATQTDPQILRFLLTAAKLRAQYDPMKFSPIVVRRDSDVQA